MQNELLPIRIEYTPEFFKALKNLSKRYPSIQKDVQEFIPTIKTDNFPGDRLKGVIAIVYKARIINSDNQKGKSHGYRIIYCYEKYPQDYILLVTIYSKSDQPDISANQINSIVKDYQHEKRLKS